MIEQSIEFTIFLIFTSAAIFATVALYAKQAMIVAYILLGLILGPWGVGLISDPKLISEISNIGIKVGSRRYPYHRIKSFWIISFSKLVFTSIGFPTYPSSLFSCST